MSNLKISQLTATTDNSIGSWLVINNSGETITNKSQVEYVIGLTRGSGTNSIQSNDFLTPSGSTASGSDSISIGNGSTAAGSEGIAIGRQALASEARDIAIGLRANTQATESQDGIAIGTDARVVRDYGIAIGYDAVALTDGIAIGRSARPIGDNCTAIGASNIAAGNGGFAIGYQIFSDKQEAGAIGANLYVDGEYSLTIGSNNDVGQTGGQSPYCYVFGYNNSVSDGARSSMVFGSNITVRSDATIAISNEVVDLGTNSPNAVFIMGTGHTVNTRVGQASVALGGFYHTFSNGGAGSFNYGGSGNTISSTSDNSGIFSSVDSETYGHSRLSGIYGSRNSYVSGTTASTYSTWGSGIYSSNEGDIRNGQFSTIVGGSSNSIQESGAVSIIGSGQSVIKGLAGEALIGGSGQSTIDANNNINNVKNVILASDDAVLFDTDLCAIIGGDNNVISGGSLNFIFGGRNSVIQDNCFNSDMLGSDESSIIDVDFALILNSKDCILSGASTQRNAMINCSGTTIRTDYNQIGIGLVGRTPAQVDTTFVENLYYYQRLVSRVQAPQSGATYTFDITQGSRGQITLTANTTITLSGLVDGASFVLKTENSGTYDATWVAQSGFNILWSQGDDNTTHNRTDLWRFEVFGTTVYGQKIADFL